MHGLNISSLCKIISDLIHEAIKKIYSLVLAVASSDMSRNSGLNLVSKRRRVRNNGSDNKASFEGYH
jgi:hypothetical protein